MKITLQNRIIIYIIENNINYDKFSICSYINDIKNKTNLMIKLYDKNYMFECFSISLYHSEIFIQYFIKKLGDKWNLNSYLKVICRSYIHPYISKYINNSTKQNFRHLIKNASMYKIDIFINILNHILKQNKLLKIYDTQNNLWLDLISFFCFKIDSNEIIKYLINSKFYNIDDVNKNGSTPLMFACQLKRFEIIRLLIEKGADINKINENRNKNSIMWAVYTDNYYIYNSEIITYLLENGANYNLVDWENKSLLYYTCLNNDIENTQFLLNNLTDINLNLEKYNNILPILTKTTYKLFTDKNIIPYDDAFYNNLIDFNFIENNYSSSDEEDW